MFTHEYIIPEYIKSLLALKVTRIRIHDYNECILLTMAEEDEG